MRHGAGLVLLTTLAGCGDALVPDAASDARVAIQMDSVVYHLTRVPGGYDAKARLSVTAQGSGPLYFWRCMPADRTPGYDLRRVGPDPSIPTALEPVWACVGGVPMGRMDADTTVTITVPLGSLDSPLANPPITPEQRVGTFRASVTLCRRNDPNCAPADRIQAETAPFEVTY